MYRFTDCTRSSSMQRSRTWGWWWTLSSLTSSRPSIGSKAHLASSLIYYSGWLWSWWGRTTQKKQLCSTRTSATWRKHTRPLFLILNRCSTIFSMSIWFDREKYFFSVTRRSRSDSRQLLTYSLTHWVSVSTDLTDVTLVSDDTYWRLDWCYSSNWGYWWRWWRWWRRLDWCDPGEWWYLLKTWLMLL